MTYLAFQERLNLLSFHIFRSFFLSLSLSLSLSLPRPLYFVSLYELSIGYPTWIKVVVVLFIASISRFLYVGLLTPKAIVA